MKALPRRYRYHQSAPVTVDLGAELADNSIERALREATGVLGGLIPEAALAEVRELRVSGRRLLDLSPLARLPRLERLWIRSHVARDLRPLATLSSLRELVLTDLPVTDLKGLRGLSGLEQLRLEGLPVSDLKPLEELAALSDLCLRSTRVSDLAPLRRLTALRELEITDGEPLDDLEDLAGLPSLRYVNLAGTHVRTVGDLAERMPEVSFEGLPSEPDFGVPFRVIDSADGQRWTGDRLVEETTRVAERMLHWPCAVKGMFADGAAERAFPPNPWDLPSELTVAEALERIWSPLERRAPGFVAELSREVFGVALIEPLGADEPVLVYLRRRALDPERHELGLLIGRPPRDPRRQDGALFRIPCCLRELYSVHGGLVAEGTALEPPERLRSLTERHEPHAERFRSRNRGQDPDQFQLFLDEDELGGKVFDLERLDARGDPIVRCWYRETDEIEGSACFWDWFEDHAPEALLHVDAT